MLKVCVWSGRCSKDMSSTVALTPSSKKSKSVLSTVKEMESKFSKKSANGKELGSMSAFCISGLAALSSHLVHHPLYTLKSHMMMRGSDFQGRMFLDNIRRSPVRFLYRGEYYVNVCNVSTASSFY